MESPTNKNCGLASPTKKNCSMSKLASKSCRKKTIREQEFKNALATKDGPDKLKLRPRKPHEEELRPRVVTGDGKRPKTQKMPGLKTEAPVDYSYCMKSLLFCPGWGGTHLESPTRKKCDLASPTKKNCNQG